MCTVANAFGGGKSEQSSAPVGRVVEVTSVDQLMAEVGNVLG
jgi:hypothetical protein